ncbi:hypothetical protein [Bailinhaonella thermotolerans]|uniref:Uncharacterized protein n=1 Tax=Bailinhaonella thermotolerans TaxID=1070861 RepID=A0A3A4A1J9_9ACTN|nr:hypothetical protein [Bailinhaonella thermotolerans]RJL21216.1 hypothetical protein D5H75_37760 [Bailinhaonella thermotolerans]
MSDIASALLAATDDPAHADTLLYRAGPAALHQDVPASARALRRLYEAMPDQRAALVERTGNSEFLDWVAQTAMTTADPGDTLRFVAGNTRLRYETACALMRWAQPGHNRWLGRRLLMGRPAHDLARFLLDNKEQILGLDLMDVAAIQVADLPDPDGVFHTVAQTDPGLAAALRHTVGSRTCPLSWATVATIVRDQPYDRHLDTLLAYSLAENQSLDVRPEQLEQVPWAWCASTAAAKMHADGLPPIPAHRLITGHGWGGVMMAQRLSACLVATAQDARLLDQIRSDQLKFLTYTPEGLAAAIAHLRLAISPLAVGHITARWAKTYDVEQLALALVAHPRIARALPTSCSLAGTPGLVDTLARHGAGPDLLATLIVKMTEPGEVSVSEPRVVDMLPARLLRRLRPATTAVRDRMLDRFDRDNLWHSRDEQVAEAGAQLAAVPAGRERLLARLGGLPAPLIGAVLRGWLHNEPTRDEVVLLTATLDFTDPAVATHAAEIFSAGFDQRLWTEEVIAILVRNAPLQWARLIPHSRPVAVEVARLLRERFPGRGAAVELATVMLETWTWTLPELTGLIGPATS